MFGSTGFNFGTPAVSQPAATSSGSIFGAGTTTQSGGLFGSSPAPAQPFGSTPLFGQAPQAAASPAPSTGLFGGFGATQPAATGFGASAAAKPPAFNFGSAASTAPTTSLFATPAATTAPFGAQPTQPSLFGSATPAAPAAAPATGLFGGFGQPAQTAQPISGTTIKFAPLQASDTAQKGALSTTVTTKHMVITAMKEYEGKSLEELRLEDYMANRKGPAPGSTTVAPAAGGLFGGATAAAKPAGTGLFGSTAPQPTTSLFGTTQPTSASSTGFSFGQPSTSTANTGLFATPSAPAAPTAAAAPFSFGTAAPKPTLTLPTTSAPSAFSFGTPAAQPATTGLFGAKPATAPAPAFGATSTFGGAFGSLAQPTATTAAANSLFGAPTSTAPAAGGLFAPKPAATAAPFGFGSTTTTTAFPAPGATSSLFPATSTAAAAGTSIFGAPPAAPTAAAAPFSFGQPSAPAAPTLGFGAQPAAAPFGAGATTTGGLFSFPGASTTAPAQPPQATVFSSNVETAATAMMQALVHQKLLSLARCQPAYSVLFREPVAGASEASGSIASTRLTSSGALDLGSSGSGSSFSRSLLPSGDGLGNLRTNLSVASSLPSTTMTARPHSGGGLFEMKPRFGAGSGSASRLGLTWSGVQPSNGTTSSARWSPSKLGVDTNAASPRSVISPLSLAPRHSIRQLIPKRFSNTMDSSAADMSAEEPGFDQTRTIDNGRVPDINMHNPVSGRGGVGLTAEHGLLGADISVVRPDGADTSFTDRIPSTGIRGGGSMLPSSTPLNPRPITNTTPKGRHVPLIKIEEHQTPAGTSNASIDKDAWQEEYADEQPQSSPESRLRSSVQRRQQHIQQSRPTLNRQGYSSVPRIADLQPTINENSEDSVEWFADEFQVYREGYGSVVFHGRVNLTGMNLDQLILIESGEIVVYPDESIKPPVGQGLNRPSTLTLEGIFPEDKSTREPTRSPGAVANHRRYLQEMSGRLGAQFIDYRPETGAWIIKVPHFTRYGLLPTDGAVAESQRVNKASNVPQPVGLTKFPSMASSTITTSETPYRRRNNAETDDVMMCENNQGGVDVQHFLERIERLQSKTERQLSSSGAIVSAEMSIAAAPSTTKHSLERHVKTTMDSNAHKARKRLRRVPWPSMPVEITAPPGLQSFVAAKTLSTRASSSVSLETIARENYFVRGCRCSFVPGTVDTKVICISSRDPHGSFQVNIASLSEDNGNPQESSFTRFISRCIDVTNKWSSGSSNPGGIFSALVDCCTADCSLLPFVSCAQKLFSLCAALWSNQSSNLEKQSLVNETTKRKLLDWLGQYAMGQNKSSCEGAIKPDLLFGRRSDALRTIAATSPRLALILAQADGNPASLNLLLQQLTTWDQSGILRRFLAADPANVHLISLAANCPYLDITSSDRSQESIQLFGQEQLRQKYGWRCALAAQLRYGPSALPSVPLADAIREFDTFQSSYPENYSPNALPPSDLQGIDAAAYNLLLVYSKTDLQSVVEHLLNAVSAVQLNAADHSGCDETWALSGNGDLLAWLLLRGFAIAGCFDGKQTDAYKRISMISAIKLAISESSFTSSSLQSITTALSQCFNRRPGDVEHILKKWADASVSY